MKQNDPSQIPQVSPGILIDGRQYPGRNFEIYSLLLQPETVIHTWR